jgi:uncharacterized alkaline shock family protein YloU
MSPRPEAEVNSSPAASTTDLSKPVEPSEPPARVGLNELGRIQVGARTVEKIAAYTAAEIPDAGGASARVLGRSVPGFRRASLERLPKVSADVDGELVFLDVEMSIRWPAPIAAVSEAVRQHLFRNVGDLVGLRVREVNIAVTSLITDVDNSRVS